MAMSKNLSQDPLLSQASMPSLILVVAIALSVLLTFELYGVFSSPLRHIPGPFLARFTRFWELFAQRSGRFEEINIALHEQHGPIVRLGPNRFSLASPDAVKTIYAHGSKFVKTEFYDAFGHGDSVKEVNIFTARDPIAHAASRRRVAPLYAMSTLLTNYEESIDSCTKTLSQCFRDFANTGQSVDMREWLQFYAYDVIGEITVGRSFGLMNAGKDSGILGAIDAYLVYASQIGLLPEWHLCVSKVARWLTPFSAVVSEIDTQIRGQIRELSEGKDVTRNDFMAKMMVLMKEGRVSIKDIENAVGSNIGAGSDTTAISLSSVVLELARNPDCAGRLREEIERLASEGEISDPITFKEAQQMPYLQAIIKEALRVHPAVGQILARSVPAGGAEIDGNYFPAGTMVGTNPWVINHNKEIFGADADHFRPERWLESKEKSNKMDQFNLAFGAGSRTCVGKHISLLEMNKVLPQLFRTFNFELVHMAPNQNDWFVKQNFECQITLRNS